MATAKPTKDQIWESQRKTYDEWLAQHHRNVQRKKDAIAACEETLLNLEEARRVVDGQLVAVCVHIFGEHDYSGPVCKRCNASHKMEASTSEPT